MQKKNEFQSQTMILKFFTSCQNTVLSSSFCLTYCIDHRGNKLSDGEYIKEVFLECSSLFSMISMASSWLKKEMMGCP